MSRTMSEDSMPRHESSQRRRFLSRLIAGLSALGATLTQAQDTQPADELHFPGDEPQHKMVFQFNQAEPEYQQHVLFSVGEMVRRYGDGISLVVTCFGPGIHILALRPQRPVSEEIKQRVSSLNDYGVKFHACNNTLKSLNWTAEDLVPFAQVVAVGAADLMELQEKGYAYISW